MVSDCCWVGVKDRSRALGRLLEAMWLRVMAEMSLRVAPMLYLLCLGLIIALLVFFVVVMRAPTDPLPRFLCTVMGLEAG